MHNSSPQSPSPFTIDEHNKKLYAIVGSLLIVAIAMWIVGRLAFPQKYQSNLVSSGDYSFSTDKDVYTVKPGVSVAVKVLAKVPSGQKFVAGRLSIGNLPKFAYDYGFNIAPQLGGKAVSNFSTTPIDGKANIVLYELNFANTTPTEIGTFTFKISDGMYRTDINLLGEDSQTSSVFTTEMTSIDANNTPTTTHFSNAKLFTIDVEAGFPTGTPAPSASPSVAPSVPPSPTPTIVVSRCAVQGDICKTAADCGTCGATCEPLGNQNSGTTVISGCNYVKPDPTRAVCAAPPVSSDTRSGPECQCQIPERWDPIGKKCGLVCTYPNPPTGCKYIGGGTNPFLCDAQLVCNTPAPSPATYPYISGTQVTCGSCLAQGKTYACYDIHDPEHLYEQGFCSDTKIAFTPAHIMDTPDCSFCQAGPGVGWCPEDTQTCPGGFKISREGPSCTFPVCPTERKFAVTFNNEPLQVGKKPTSMGVCAVDQNGKIDTTYRGFITVTFETGGPIGDQPFGFFYSIDQFSKGCHTFPGGYIKFVRPGTQKVTVSSQSIRFAYGDTEGTPPTTVSVNVLAASATPTPSQCPSGQVKCADSQCYPGNCCSNNDCPSGQSCSDNSCRPVNFTPSPTPTTTGAPVCPNGAVNSPQCDMCDIGYHLVNGQCMHSSAGSPSPSVSPSASNSPTPSASATPSSSPSPQLSASPKPSTSPTISVCRATRGDLNCDNHVDVADLAMLVDYITLKIDLTGQAYKNADLNGDKKVDVADLAKLVDYITLKIDTL